MFIFSRKQLFLIAVVFLFSWYMFGKSFSYDQKQGQFLIASNVYADFGVHIPFIRSFSLGANLPAETPGFAGKALPYHFLPNFYAGVLEYAGLRIDIAFNLISSFAFVALLLFIYDFAVFLFKKTSVGILSVIFFLCSNNFALFDFLNGKKFSLSLLSSFWHNTTYFLAGPLGQTTMLVYWTLDTYVNQRQLIFGMAAIMILLSYLFQKEKQSLVSRIFIGVLSGMMPFWNTPLFLAELVILGSYLVIYFKNWKKAGLILFVTLLIAFPSTFLISQTSGNHVVINPGFVLAGTVTLIRFFLFWQWNMGVMLWLLFIGLFFAKKEQRKFFIFISSLFVVVNMFQFSSALDSSHKLINVWFIFVNMFAAVALVNMLRKGFITKLCSFVFFLIIILSGMLNFLVIKNDVYARIYDYPSNSLMIWAKQHIPAKSIVATNGEIYDPMLLIGKRIFLGRLSYLITYGGSVMNRVGQQDMLLAATNGNEVKSILKTNMIQYVVLYKGDYFKNTKLANTRYYNNNFKKIYEDKYGTIYKM